MLRLLICLLCALTLCSCAPDKELPPDAPPRLTPMDKSDAKGVLERLNLAVDREDLLAAVERSMVYVSRQDQQAVAVTADEQSVSWAMLLYSLQSLQAALTHPDPEALLRVLEHDFVWYELGPRTLLTGYYEPLLHASDVPGPEYPYPIYGRPPDLKTVDLGQFRPELSGKRLTYRVVDDGDGLEIAPYHDRAAIDFAGALGGQGLEIAWVKDPFEVFSLHIQGSGRLEYPDGTVRHVLYDAQNGRPYVSLGREMADRGLMELSQVSMPNIRDYLLAHPEQIPELLSINPSYVFFRLSDDGPYGSIGQVLTPMASLAVDRKTLPLGAPLMLDAHVPEPNEPVTEDNPGQPFVSLMLAQDTGGAIKGTRADLFCGFGDQAYAVAGRLKAKGRLYLLLSRDVLGK